MSCMELSHKRHRHWGNSGFWHNVCDCLVHAPLETLSRRLQGQPASTLWAPSKTQVPKACQTFHMYPSLVYVIWNYVTGIKGLGINASDSWKSGEGTTDPPPGLGGGGAKQWFISDRHQPEGLLSQGVCKAAGAMVMPHEAWTTGTPGAKCWSGQTDPRAKTPAPLSLSHRPSD